MKSLRGTIALVTGTSRGAERGIAVELGKAGATVYSPGEVFKGNQLRDGLAPWMKRCRKTGVALRCDHTRDEDVEAVIDRIRREQGRLDLLVNNVWGGNELPIESEPFWEMPLTHWDHMFTAGVGPNWRPTVSPFL